MARFLSSLTALAVLLCCTGAFPLAGNHPAGYPVGQNPEWPAGLADLLNSPGRVHGYFINANDFFFYVGDTDEFNQFLGAYARLEKTSLTLVLQRGPGKTNFITPDDKEIVFDWEVNLYCRGWAREAPPDPTGKAGRYVIVLDVFPGRQVEMNKIQVPLNVRVRSDLEDEKVAEFIAAHQAKQKGAKKAKDETKAPGSSEAEEATVRFIDLDPYVTAPLEAFHGGAVASDLPLEPGRQRIGGFEFLVGKGIIQLAGSNLVKMPREVKGIKIGLKLKGLRILHSCSWDVTEGTRIGSYAIHYGDGATVEIPVEYGVHVKDWWADWGQMAEVPGAEVAWTGGTALSPPVRLYVMTWENPSPGKVVATIDCTSKGTACAPFIVAMTAEGVQASGTASETEPAGPAERGLERLRYARIALNEDGSKALSVLFDESNGTGTGYDLLYADTNFNGKFEEAEKLNGRTLERDGQVISSSFPPLEVGVAYNSEGKSPGRWRIAFGYHAPRSESGAERSGWVSQTPVVSVGNFHVTANLTLDRDGEQWRYFMSGDIQPAESLQAAATWDVTHGLKLEVSTRPDGRNEGNLGIALQLDAGENKLACQKAGSLVKARVEIKQSDGTVVHKGEETLDKFVFG